MRLIIVGLALAALLGPSATAAWNNNNNNNNDESEHQPAPEPYSFSYSAESTGGFSSRQETGDGTGRVEGFYIIMGDDQRERRVDYVADKDGYRASISTNEIGTRSQSSADAQYQARLPSQGQLEQAKITLDEYKFMEEQHEFERTRPLNLNSQQMFQTNRKQVQTQQQAEQLSNQLPATGQRWSASASGSRQSDQAANTGADWQQQQQRWTTSQNQGASANTQQTGNQLAQAFSNNQTTTTTTTDARDDENWRSAKLLATGVQQTQQQQQQQRLRGTGLSSTLTAPNTDIETGPVFNSNSRSQVTAQQTNLPAWRVTAAPSGGVQTSGRLVSTQATDFGRQQFNQQFMQQASQLAAEDYPRQQQQQQQQQQEVGTSQQVVEQPGGQQVVAGQQGTRQQSQWQNQQFAANNNVARDQEAYSQLGQQQNNIIDEVSGEQLDLSQQVGGQTPAAENLSTTSGPQPIEPVEPVRSSQLSPQPVQPQPQFQQPQKLQPQQQQPQQPQQPQPQPQLQQQPQPQPQQFQQQSYEEQTTTKQPVAPSGFLAIDLGRQEAEIRPEAPNTNLQTTTGSQQQAIEAEQVVDVQDQRQEVQFQQRQPESIQQIIREGAIKQQKQAAFTKPTTQQPTTTFKARPAPETSTTFQPVTTTTTTTTTTRTPIDTTITTAAKSTSIDQGGFSTLLLEQPTRKPTLPRQPQQAQFVSKGVKGGSRRTEQRITTTTSPEQPQAVSEIPRIPTNPIKAYEYERTRPTYQLTEQVVPERPTTQQAPSSAQSFNVREQQQQQQLELVTSAKVAPTSTTAQPVRFETTIKENPVTQSQPRQWTGGVKGGSKGANRRQFWQSSEVAASGKLPSLVQQKSASVQTGGQASVDYAGQPFGSRVLIRSN